MKLGYARVSTPQQVLSLQIDALTRAGCDRIFQDTASGSRADRPGYEALLSHVRRGDTIVVWRLDRLGRNLTHLLAVVNRLATDGVDLVSLTEDINTATASGKLMLHIAAVLAEFERNLLIERTQAGLAAARARGRVGGRKPILTPAKRHQLYSAWCDKENTIADLCDTFRVSRRTLYRVVRAEQARQSAMAQGVSA